MPFSEPVAVFHRSSSFQRTLGPSVVTSADTTLGPDFRQDDGDGPL